MNISKRKKFSALNLSIEKRLPLSIFLLLSFVIITLTTISYIGVRNTSMQVGEERLNSLTTQFTGLFSLSTQRMNLTVKETSEADFVINFFLSRGSFDKEAIKDSLRSIFNRDTLTHSVGLWSPNERLLISTDESFTHYELLDEMFNDASSGSEVLTGKIYLLNDTMFYPIVTDVRHNDELIGYLVRWRIIRNSEQSIKQITGLLGENASLYVGNNDGSLWTDLVNVKPPPVEGRIENGISEYKGVSGEVIAGVNNIPGTPWLFIIELSKDALLETADKFLTWILIGGFIVLILGVTLSVIMSRNITRPLNQLNRATSDIANGNYEASVELNREDELGKLANSFNIMVEMIRNSRTELEMQVADRTAQLRSANSELKELNSKLKELDAIKTNFFTNISHELRTPLSLILGPVEKMLSGSRIDSRDKKELAVIQQNARVLLKHVNNLLDLSKLEVGKLNLQYSEFDFAAAVRMTASYFESLAEEENINLEIAAPQFLSVQADYHKIERVLLNLFSNAFKATPLKGTIKCIVQRTEDGQAEFEIRDSGEGIREDVINSLFQRFSGGFGNMNRNLASSGLGLSIVKEFIEMHGGIISANNSPDGGAVFRFRIPLKAPHPVNEIQKIETELSQDFLIDKELGRKLEIPDDPSVAYNPLDRPGAPVVLVVEDNPQMNTFIAEILNEDYNVITAFNGEEGLRKALEHYPDLILTDVMMPVMSGDKMVEKILSDKRLSAIPVVLLTARANEQLKVELLMKGAYDYLNKPFSVAELKARVANIIMFKLTRVRLQEELQSRSMDVSLLARELIEKKQHLEESLKEKEVLIQEIHHRVKNNLQIISSLLSLQSNFIEDEGTLQTLVESQNRIRSMALVHEQLYSTTNLAQINMDRYIHNLVEHLINIYKSGANKITAKIEVHEEKVSLDTAITAGLIINELVSNSLKYAFNERSSGELCVSFRRDLNNYILIIKDDGEGIQSENNQSGEKSFGLLIVQSLTSQLEGKYEVINENGTESRIIFPVEQR